MSKNKMQVVFASAEAAPFIKTGGLGDVAGSLPQALVKAGADVIVMVPKYSSIPQVFKDQMQHVGEFYVSLGWRNEYCGLERLEYQGVTYLFLDNEHYFDRSYPYGFYDDGERFAFFSKAVTESLQYLPDGFECDVLHCNDWHTAMAPVFLREFYQGLPLYERVKTVFTIHNIAFQGQFSDKMLNDVLGLAHIPAAARQLRCDATSINFMLGALNYTDSITTVSPTYAWEIQTSDYGERLDGVLRRRNNILRGILNGIDLPSWDPATDIQIPAHYTVGDMAGKLECKHALQRELGLEVRDDRPLMVMVTRLTRQKGMDLVTYSLDRILSGGVQVAVLGTGDRAYEDALNYFQGKYPGTMAARITFDPALSRRMYAGADLFLMPSLFEPCGLSQIIAMRYGTLPIVRETGGLRDTVTPYNYETGEGTGFSFANFNGDEMGDAVFRAARLYWDNRPAFDNVVKQAMERDFSWTKSADQYMDLYKSLHPEIEVVPPAPEPQPAPEPEPAPDAASEPEPEPIAEKEAAAEEPAAEPEKAPAEEKPAPEPEPAPEPAPEPEPVKAEPAAEEAPAPKAAAKAPVAKKPAAKRATKATTAKAAATKTVPKAAAKSAAVEEAPVDAAKPAAKKTATRTATKTTKSAAKTTASKAASAAKAATETEPAAPAETPKKPAAKTTKTATATKAATKATAAKATAAKKAAEPAAPAAAPDAEKTPAKPAAKAAKAPAAKASATKTAVTASKTAKAATTAKTATAVAKAAATVTEPAAGASPAEPAAPAPAKSAAAKPAARKTVSSAKSASRKTASRKRNA